MAIRAVRTAPSGDTTPYTPTPVSIEDRIRYIARERMQVIQVLARQSLKARSVPDPAIEPTKSLLPRLDAVLEWMAEELEMIPEIKTRTRIDAGLKLIFDDPRFHFSRVHTQKARELFQKWEIRNWGAGNPAQNNETPEQLEAVAEEKDSKRPAKRRKRSIDNEKTQYDSARLPPANHPIWGTRGIMHGVARSPGPGKGLVLDKRYAKRSAQVYGSNGLAVGAWFPFRMVALFRGAHGSAQAGIAGDKTTGAYSIVVSGFYEDLDKDMGDVLFYSGSNSHDNEDPRTPPPSTAGTLALHASIDSEKPVRVLRTHSGRSAYAPVKGLRYDGLYQVVSSSEPKNKRGGKYEQFKLVRLGNQPPIDRSRPNASEVRDFERIERDY